MKKYLPVIIVIVAVGLRLYFSTLGVNTDVYAFLRTAKYTLRGDIIYVATTKYNYGPLWSYILAGIYWLQSQFMSVRLGSFHVFLCIFMCGVDLCIAYLLNRRFGLLVASIFLLNPVGILLTGYHTQFDNLAFLVAYLAWELLDHTQVASNKKLIQSAALLGVSLILKHIFFLFPIWALFCKSLGSLSRRIAYAAIAYAIFFGSFLPYIWHPVARKNIIDNVLMYSSRWRNNSLLYTITQPIVELVGVPLEVYNFSIKLLFMGVLLGLGVIASKRANARDLALWYSVALVISSSALAHQYIMIPLAACAIFYRSLWPWTFYALAIVLMCTSKNNIGNLEAMGHWKVRGIVPSAAIQFSLLMMYLKEMGLLEKLIPKRIENQAASLSPDSRLSHG